MAVQRLSQLSLKCSFTCKMVQLFPAECRHHSACSKKNGSRSKTSRQADGGPVVRGRCESQPSRELQPIPPTLAQSADQQKVAGVSDIDPFATEDPLLYSVSENLYLRIVLNLGFNVGRKAGLKKGARQRQRDQENSFNAESLGLKLYFEPIQVLSSQQPRKIANPSQASPSMFRAVRAAGQQKILWRGRARLGVADTSECCALK